MDLNTGHISKGQAIYNTLIRSSVDSVVVMDLTGNILEVSTKTVEVLGYNNQDELIGKPIYDFLAIDELEKAREQICQTLIKNNTHSIEYKLLRKNKSIIWGEINSALVSNSEGEPYCIIAISRDITRYKLENKKHEAIFEISETVSKSKSLNELYSRVHGIIKDLIFADNFYIAIYDEQTKTISFPYYVDEFDSGGNPQQYGPQKFGEGLTEHVIKIGKPRLITKKAYNELLDKKMVRQIGHLALEWLGVPLTTIDNKTIGLIAVQNYDKDYHYSQDDIDMLAFVSTQVAMAIERKKKEDSLLVLKEAVQSSGEVIFITDIDGILTYINPAFTELYGFTEDEIIGKATPRILSSGKMNKDVYAVLWNSLLNRETVKGELINKTKDGRYIFIEGSASAIMDKENKIIGFLGVQRNINERKESENLSNALYKISEAANYTSDLQTLYVKIHEIVKSLMPAENFYIALYDPMTELISFPYFVDEYDPPQAPKTAGFGLTEYVLRSGKGILINAEVEAELRKNGKAYVIGTAPKIWLGVPLKIFNDVTGVMVVQDYENELAFGNKEKEILTFVSEQVASAIYKKKAEQELLEFTTELQNHKLLLEKRAEELSKVNRQLAASEKELQELNSAKDKYFSIIAHDLKSPFNGLLGFSNLLISDYHVLNDDEIQSYIRHMDSSIKNIFNLVENLLDWSRIQTGRIEFIPERLQLRQTIRSVISPLEGNAIKKEISIDLRVAKEFCIVADRKMLTSVVQNLTANAIKFTDPGGRIIIDAQRQNGFVKISVEDSGTGISKERTDNLFRIDKQITTSGTANEKGTGLGLLLCKEFVEKCGGEISVESTLGKGSVFSFTMPGA